MHLCLLLHRPLGDKRTFFLGPGPRIVGSNLRYSYPERSTGALLWGLAGGEGPGSVRVSAAYNSYLVRKVCNPCQGGKTASYE